MTETLAHLPTLIANNADSLEANLDRAKAALTNATTDFQRMQIRQGAEALAAAAAIMQRTDIWLNAAELVCRAERAIHKANPPAKGGRGNKGMFQKHGFKVDTLRHIRAAHQHLPDAVFEAACKDAREAATPLTRAALKAIGKVHRHASRVEATTEAVMPPGVFETIVCDPPWPYPDRPYNPETTHGRYAPPYKTMPMDQIEALHLPAAADSALWLWTTDAFYPDARRLLELWEFAYSITLVWKKTNFSGNPHNKWLRGMTEFCLLATRGKPHVDTTVTYTTLLTAPAREHSRLPDAFYELAKAKQPHARRLDYFSREPRKGWHQYGNQCNYFPKAA